ncbi:hypothetical protein CDL15_Pgr004410 [Punica granatum]|uniref:Potassium channel tetramerisation-type BTB domain-containing protein n=1 Tax=Punica granatum TaxID=22663 RepID=A0A218XH16_PUNGR|nr:hypothetical protein CDL15_Pgr004410 [Punica granatum]
MMGINGDLVRFNVGGKRFKTTATTLANAGHNSFFAALFNENWDLQPAIGEEIFIDRSHICSAILLDLLRTGELHILPNVPEAR